MDSPEQIAVRLKRLREAMGFQQAKMWCQFLGIPENTWNHFERGRRPVTVDVAIRIAGKTGVTLDWIYRGLESTLPMHVVERLNRVPECPIKPSRRVSNG